MPNLTLADQLVLSDQFRYSLGNSPLVLALSDQLTMRDAYVLAMINPAGSTQGAWSIEIGETMVMSDHFSNPTTLVTQAAIELIRSPTSAYVRLTQAPVEVVESPTDTKFRATQVIVEVIAKTPQGSITGSQIQMRIQ